MKTKFRYFLAALAIFAINAKARKAAPEQILKKRVSLPLPRTRPLLIAENQSGGFNIMMETEQSALVFFSGGQQTTLGVSGKIVHSQADQNQKFLALVTAPQKTKKSNGLRLRLLQNDGVARFEKSLPWAADAPLPALAINPATGAVLWGDPAMATLHFLNAGGEEMKQIEVFEDAAYALERPLHLRISGDGEVIAVASTRTPAHPGMSDPDKNARLILFGREGELSREIWLPEPSVYALDVSDDGERILVSTFNAYATGGMVKKTRLLARNGRTIAEYDDLYRRAVFDDAGRSALLFEKNRWRRIDLDAGATFFSGVEERLEKIILAAAIKPGGERTALLLARETFFENGFHYLLPQIIFLDRSGARTGEYQPEGDAVAAPFLLSALRGNELLLILERHLEQLSWME